MSAVLDTLTVLWYLENSKSVFRPSVAHLAVIAAI